MRGAVRRGGGAAFFLGKHHISEIIIQKSPLKVLKNTIVKSKSDTFFSKTSLKLSTVLKLVFDGTLCESENTI